MRPRPLSIPTTRTAVWTRAPWITSLALTLLCVATVAPTAHAQASDDAPAQTDGETIAARIDAYLEPYAAASQVSGSVLVARGEEILYERSFGLANRELDVPIEASSRFNIASVTKPMTQIIALRLIDAGTLTLDDPISKWLPDFPKGDTITVGMVLRHQAGIPHRVTTDEEETRPMTAADIVERVQKQELLFEPGSDTTYSSAGYSVLARVLELASGKSYEQLLAEHVFGPGGMTQSIHPAGYALIPDRASGYQFSATGDLVNMPPRHYSFLVGAGSVFSTPRDLQRLMRTLVDGGFGETASSTMMRETGITWNGRTDGYRAFADYHADTGVYIAFTSNILSGSADLLRRDLPLLAVGKSVEPPAVPSHQAVKIDPETLKSYQGHYELRPGRNLTLSVEGDEVRMSGWLLIPIAERTFFSPQDWAEITVIPAEDGTVERLDWTIAGKTYPMPRVDEIE